MIIDPIVISKPWARMLACLAEYLVISYCFRCRPEGDPDAYADVGGIVILAIHKEKKQGYLPSPVFIYFISILVFVLNMRSIYSVREKKKLK